MAKTAINKKTFHREIYSDLKKKLVKFCIWNVAFCGAENWTLREVYQKYLESFEFWCRRSRDKISCTGGVKN